MNVKEIRKLSGLNVRQFTERYKIPYTTFHDWDTGKSNPPVYVLELLERAVREDWRKEIENEERKSLAVHVVREHGTCKNLDFKM